MFSTDPSEPGLFAVGQVSFGVFALGQAAVGLVAVGQAAVGLVALGQGAIGLYWGAGMLNVGARGFPLNIAPRYPVPRELPDTTDLSQVEAGYGDGWIEADLRRSHSGTPALFFGSVPADVRLQASLIHAAEYELETHGEPKVVAHVKRVGGHLVCDRLVHVLVPPTEQPGFWRKIGWRTAILTAVAVPLTAYVLFPLFA